jgi:hypothetical protein
MGWSQPGDSRGRGRRCLQSWPAAFAPKLTENCFNFRSSEHLLLISQFPFSAASALRATKSWTPLFGEARAYEGRNWGYIEMSSNPLEGEVNVHQKSD